MRIPYQPPPYVEAALIEDLKIGFPMIFSEAKIIGGDWFHVGYNEQNWQLTARGGSALATGQRESQQMVAYSYDADATASGGFRWVCEGSA